MLVVMSAEIRNELELSLLVGSSAIANLTPSYAVALLMHETVEISVWEHLTVAPLGQEGSGTASHTTSRLATVPISPFLTQSLASLQELPDQIKPLWCAMALNPTDLAAISASVYQRYRGWSDVNARRRCQWIAATKTEHSTLP
jgi:hypothetical protein